MIMYFSLLLSTLVEVAMYIFLIIIQKGNGSLVTWCQDTSLPLNVNKTGTSHWFQEAGGISSLSLYQWCWGREGQELQTSWSKYHQQCILAQLYTCFSQENPPMSALAQKAEEIWHGKKFQSWECSPVHVKKVAFTSPNHPIHLYFMVPQKRHHEPLTWTTHNLVTIKSFSLLPISLWAEDIKACIHKFKNSFILPQL